MPEETDAAGRPGRRSERAVGSTAPGAAQVAPAVRHEEMGRALGVLYMCGASLALVWTALPHGPRGGDGVVVVMAVLALVLGASLVLGAVDRAPDAALHVVLGGIQLVISVAFVAVSLAGDPTNDIRLFYLWATPFAAFFFSRRAALWHSAWTALCLAVSLLLLVRVEAPAELLRVWLMTVGTLVAVGVLVSTVAGRMRQVHARLQHAAWHDGLSGLANRELFERRTEEALLARDRTGGTVHVLLLDLDRFKLVNDTYGHHTGDALIVQVAQRLRTAVGPGATVARMGGDEFAVLATSGVCAAAADRDGGATEHDPHLPDDLLERLATVWHEPVDVDGTRLPVSGTVGVVSTARPGRTAEGLLRDADVALYRAKQTSRGTVRHFDHALRVEVERGARLDHELRHALARRELTVVYQAVVDLPTERPAHAEALLRWRSPVLGDVGPAEFVPIAEEHGLIGDIGRFVLEQVVADLAAWRAAGLVDERFGVAVNVSPRQLDEDFPGLLGSLLERHGLPRTTVHLEITESVLLDDGSPARAVLHRLREAGSHVALDDFGTGYSSLSYLRRLPVDTLKVDRTFVAELDGEVPRLELVRAVVDLARALGLDVVAEGVETRAQAERLRALGVQWAQGWLFARPVDAQALAGTLAARRVPEPRT